MRQLDNGGRLLTDVNELPTFGRIKRLYADFETTSGDPKLDSLNPWHHCWVAGLAVTVDNEPGAWYIPVGHRWGQNLDVQAVADWWSDTLDNTDVWANANVKYDAHVSANALGILPECALKCLTTLAKIVDSDRGFGRGGYGLDALSRDWLGEDISRYEQALTPYLAKSKDYGDVPADVMAPYGAQDVITARRLDRYIDARTPEQCTRVRDTEVELTTVLYHMERRGMRIDPVQVMTEELLAYEEMFRLDGELCQLVGRAFQPHVNEDCFDVLCCQFGLPVIAWTKPTDENPQGGNPSFDKHALAAYLVHPKTTPHVREVLKRVIAYRKFNTHVSLFTKVFLKEHINGVMHSEYQQCVVTGRMACKKPNMQQNDKWAKGLLIPPEGRSFISADYSQIEFRLMMDYIGDRAAIAAFEADPDMDFHQWTADEVGIPRRPAKTMNFLIGFGGGKKKTKKALMGVPELMEELAGNELLMQAKAERTYNGFHDRFPGIKQTSRQVEIALRRRGYVFNRRGRHRHLPQTHAHKGFNAIVQSTAADIMKERTVAMWHATRGTEIELDASVHDETLMDAPHEVAEDPRVQMKIAAVLESHDVAELRIPIRCKMGTSRKSWKEASSDDRQVSINWRGLVDPSGSIY